MRSALFAAVAITSIVSCSSSVPPAPSAVATPTAAATGGERAPSLPAGLAPAGFLVGAWSNDTESERWTFAGDTLFGVGFTVKDGRTRAFEAMFVQDRASKLRFTARPDGARSVPFPELARERDHVTFANPAHDFPKRIHYRREGDKLAARVEDDARGIDFAYRAVPADRAEALEKADLAFAADTAARGLDGWMAWFDREGAMWRDGAGRVQGNDAIRALMAKTVGDPHRRLTWHPVASGFSPARDLGFTVGESVLFQLEGGARRELGRSAYLTIWRAQPDGSWKVLFDCAEPD